MIHSRLLYHFLLIAKAGSISAAARDLGVTQPALTRSVRQLEKSIGTKLLDRRPEGVVLTPDGQILARRVKLMNIEYENALAEISDREKGMSGRLRISAGPVWMLHYLPKVLEEYHRLYPNVRISMSQGGFTSQMEKLLSGEIDAMCGITDFPMHAEIETETILPLKQSAIARSGHPLMQRQDVTPKDLAKYPWVVLEDDPVSTARISSFFVAHGLEPPVMALETNTFGALSMLRQTDFLTTFAKQGIQSLQSIGLEGISHEGTFWEANSGVSKRKSSRPVPALKGFISLLRTMVPPS